MYNTLKNIIMKSREEIIKGLEDQYKAEFANNGYPTKFEAHASSIQCNFGGLLMILGNAGDSAIVWSDWSDSAVDEKLTECEVEFIVDEDDEDDDFKPAIKYKNSYYFLDSFMRISR